MLRIKQFIFNDFGESTYLITDEATKDAIVVDPGMASKDDYKRFDDFVKDNGIKVKQIVNTHLHIDHCFGINYVRDKYGVNVAAHVDDAPLGDQLSVQARMFGIPGDYKGVAIDVPLADGDVISVGKEKLYVIHTPGHTQGGICLYSPDGKFLISGDTLFQHTIGRTDHPGGNHEQLVESVNNKLLTLPDDTLVLSGHGPATTIGEEKLHNPFSWRH